MLVGKKIHVARNKNTRLWALGTLVMIRCKYTLAEIEIPTCSEYIGGRTCNDYLSDQQLLPLPIEDLADNTPTCVYNIYKQEPKIRKTVIKEIHSWPFMNCIGCANMNEMISFG